MQLEQEVQSYLAQGAARLAYLDRIMSEADEELRYRHRGELHRQRDFRQRNMKAWLERHRAYVLEVGRPCRPEAGCAVCRGLRQ